MDLLQKQKVDTDQLSEVIDKIPDDKFMDLVGCIMERCKLSFTTFIVETQK